MDTLEIDIRQAALEAIADGLDNEFLLFGREWEVLKIASHFSERHSLVEIVTGGVYRGADGGYDDDIRQEWVCTRPGCRLRASYHDGHLEVIWKTSISTDTAISQ